MRAEWPQIEYATCSVAMRTLPLSCQEDDPSPSGRGVGVSCAARAGRASNRTTPAKCRLFLVKRYQLKVQLSLNVSLNLVLF